MLSEGFEPFGKGAISSPPKTVVTIHPNAHLASEHSIVVDSVSWANWSKAVRPTRRPFHSGQLFPSGLFVPPTPVYTAVGTSVFLLECPRVPISWLPALRNEAGNRPGVQVRRGFGTAIGRPRCRPHWTDRRVESDLSQLRVKSSRRQPPRHGERSTLARIKYTSPGPHLSFHLHKQPSCLTTLKPTHLPHDPVWVPESSEPPRPLRHSIQKPNLQTNAIEVSLRPPTASAKIFAAEHLESSTT